MATKSQQELERSNVGVVRVIVGLAVAVSPAVAPSVAPSIANAQAYQCRAPAVSSVPVITPDSKPRSVPTTGYT
ncbi:MAG: hypothetical protein AAFY47_05635, partial [Pseudomonadota bacterium]